jgi:hypothetical protein
MRPGPKKPGESAAEYSARVKAMEQKWMSGMGRPKTGGGPSSVKTPGPRVTDTRGSSGGMGGSSSGGDRQAKESAARMAAEQKAKALAAATAAEKMKRGGAASGDGRPGHMGPGSGALAPGYRPPQKKPGGGKMIANNPMTKMKRGGMVKGKKK